MPGLLLPNRRITGTSGQLDPLSPFNVAAYPMLQSAGGSLLDVGPRHLDAVATGSFAGDLFGPPSPFGRGRSMQQIVGSVGVFLTSNSGSNLFPTGVASFAVWYYRQGIGGGNLGRLMEIDNGTANSSPFIIYGGSSPMTIEYTTGATKYTHSRSDITALNKWFFWAGTFADTTSQWVTWAGDQDSFYGPGGSTSTGSPASFVPSRIAIGNRANGQRSFDGYIACLYLGNRPITQNDALEVWVDPYAPVTPKASPVRYFLFPAPAGGGGGTPLLLSGQSDGVSTANGTLQVTRQLTGTAVESEAATGALARSIQLSGQSVATETVTGQLQLTRQLSGQSDGLEAISGSLSVARYLSGQIDEVETATGTLARAIDLTGQSDEAETVSGALEISRSLAAQVSESGNAAGQLEVTRFFTGQSDGLETVSGTLDIGAAIIPLYLSGQSDAVATASGQLLVERNLSGQSNGLEVVSGQLLIQRNLTGQVDGEIETLAGTLRITRNLDGQSTSLEAIDTQLLIARWLSGASAGVETVSGLIAIGSNPTLYLSGQIDAVGGATGQLQVTRNLSGKSDAAGAANGALEVTRLLAGASAGQETVSGQILITIDLVGHSDGISIVSGDLLVSRNLTGLSAGIEANSSGPLLITRYLAGTSAGIETVFGNLFNQPPFTTPDATPHTGVLIGVSGTRALISSNNSNTQAVLSSGSGLTKVKITGS